MITNSLFVVFSVYTGSVSFGFFLALVCLATPESRCTQMLAVNGEIMSNIHSLNVNCSLSQKLQQAA